MAGMQSYSPGGKFGFIPGSQEAGSRLYGPGYQGVYGYIEQDNPYDNALKAGQLESLNQQNSMAKRKFDMLAGLIGKNPFSGGGMGSSNFMSRPANNIPAPNYISAGPIWSQGQINAKAGQTRANLLNAADNQTDTAMRDMSSRGFSPFSPFATGMGQSNLMKAYGSAAQNETDLNFTAAKANSDARLQAAGINAGMYSGYADSLGRQNIANSQSQMDAYMRDRGMQLDYFKSLLSTLG